ncbi:MAG: PAS domain S-box protein [Anaerolineaceae bacterium]|nr:PAS domain S-box protein [Anaerolineaceae bacterium]
MSFLSGSSSYSGLPVEIRSGPSIPELGITLFNQSRDIILVVRFRDGRILEANAAAERAYGYPRQELLSLSISDLRAYQTQPLIGTQMQQANTSGILFETLHRRKDGTFFPVEVSSVGTEFGEERANLSIIRDISERKLAEQTITESEERYRKLVELSPDCIIVHSEGKITFINPSGARLLGAQFAEQLVGKSVVDFIPAKDQALILERIDQIKQGLPMPPLEEQIVRLDGIHVDVDFNASPILYQGNPAILLIGRDITEQKQTRQAILEREQHLRALIESTPLGLHQYELDSDGQLIFMGANSAADHILGIDHQSMIGLPIEDAFPTHRHTQIPAIYRKVALDGIPYSCEQIAYQDEQIQGVFEIHAFQTGAARMAVFFRDITEKRKIEEDLRESEEKFRTLIEQNSEGVLLIDDKGTIIEWNLAQEQILGIPREEAVGKSAWDVLARLIIPERQTIQRIESIKQGIQSYLKNKPTSRFQHLSEVTIQRPDGEQVFIRLTIFPIKSDKGYWIGSIAHDNTESKRAEEKLQQVTHWLEESERVAHVGGWALDLNSGQVWVSPEAFKIYGLEKTQLTLAMIQDIPLSEYRPALDQALQGLIAGSGKYDIEFQIKRQNDGSIRDIRSMAEFHAETRRVFGAIQDITEQKIAATALKTSEEKYRRLFSSASDAVMVYPILEGGRPGNFSEVNPATCERLGYSEEELSQLSFKDINPPEFAANNQALFHELLNNKQLMTETTHLTKDGREIPVEVSSRLFDFNGQLTALSISRDIRERKKAESKIRKQLEQLSALHTIDSAITMKLDLVEGMEVILNQVIEQLGVSAADVLLYQPKQNLLIYGAGKGFKTRIIEDTHIFLGVSLAGTIAADRLPLKVSDLSQDARFARKYFLQAEGFVSYYGAPLIANGNILGVLEIFTQNHLDEDREWLNYFEILAGQAAIAIDDARMFEGLHQTNQVLSEAYEKTIDGWSRALDLRDKETEGHSERVTDLTLALARQMGISDEQLVHIRRGARLHDIGKMGIPDRILLKPGKLTPSEWEIMRQHPTYAANLLYPIEFLGPALEIPFSHHEKWDGTGYPQGLKGEEIPIAARIFAIVDIWDALTSDRPYRKAWTREKAFAYLEKQSGKHFDPLIVKEFMALVRGSQLSADLTATQKGLDHNVENHNPEDVL